LIWIRFFSFGILEMPRTEFPDAAGHDRAEEGMSGEWDKRIEYQKTTCEIAGRQYDNDVIICLLVGGKSQDMLQGCKRLLL